MQDDYRQYLEAKHAAFQTPESAVFEMVRRATGEEPARARRIIGAPGEHLPRGDNRAGSRS